MMLYCKEENGIAQPPAALPSNYGNVSNFNALSDSQLLVYKFYPYTPSQPPQYNPLTHRLNHTYQIQGNKGQDVYTVVALSPQEQVAVADLMASQFGQIVETYLDQGVATKKYKSIVHACTWDTSSNAQWQQDALAAITWRDQVWLEAIKIQMEVMAGQRPLPTQEEFIALLPVLEW